MTTRHIKELLGITLANINLLKSGLCDLIRRLYDRGEINLEEHTILRHYFMDNEYPTRVSWYRPYWWKMGEVQPRVDWLKLHIEKNSNNIK